MKSKVQRLRAFLASAGRLALVEVAGTKGSTPREKGAFMLVSQAAIFGTIGGGQLEYMAIDKARQMVGSSPSPLWGGSAGEAGRGGGADDRAKPPRFADAATRRPLTDPPHKGEGKEARIGFDEVCATLDVPLGPEIGQCCGGRVEVLIRVVDAALTAELIAAAEAEEAHLPHVYIFGGGHVGRALAATVALLPVHGVVIETRAEALEGMPETVETRLTPMPEAEVRNAPAGTAFAILTHDHALDFLIVAEALKRDDAAYVGMIGSKTKRATFRNWFLKSAEGTEAEFARLVSPIGGDAVKDKRPPVIAALAAAEIMTALVAHGAAPAVSQQARQGQEVAG
ncbi:MULTISPECIES: xanthine dehydrogenase accessory protein XdhC [unclassified Mesorhizobium]|uniref:xanthine dehydrogenase accessory protein XdhC n=1 Tax=unclassified Mesorhizobium TaxID=325217 RepID=UPI0003CDE832|nr:MULTISPECIES: xanthine dehydrogenase accessory protein XdhC [unclassified Mesorhizobium]ESX37159.1 xanthine dehydrogenase accessory protein XdhC [Mesorhizobium sp. LSHC432A00]ESZ07338.1 xanthine dehydrogenase accessory protein XdhC [Mesorhizobium sp. L2C085B000]WJI57803.1 xanthine dehydrogenase accessory protein XdhC [Mesorhizobium sp. C432A]